MKTFVTGACGFIGSHLAEALVREGHDVTAMAIINARDTFGWLDDVATPEYCPPSANVRPGEITWVHANLQKVRGDVRDAEQMRRLIKGHDIVFHLAALGSVPYSYEAPRSFIDTNVTGTLNVLEACKEAGAKLVHTSTSEVYGTALYTPQDEKHPLQAQSPYAASKIAADKLVEAYTCTYGMDTVTLRPFNTYGPRQSERAVIPTIIRQALDPQCKIIRLGNQATARDFVYVADTVDAFMACIGLSGVFNCTGNLQFPISAVAEIIIRNQLFGSPKEVVFGNEGLTRPAESEVERLQGDFSKLEEATGWRPQTPFVQGISNTIDWWRTREFRPDIGMVA